MCNLSPSGTGIAGCQVTFSPNTGSGTHEIIATYGSDLLHDASRSGPATVTSKPAGGSPGGSNRPPNTTIVLKPRARTSEAIARFALRSDQPGVRFECRLDKRRFAPCGSPFRKRVRRGRHRFAVRAVNSDNLADPTPPVFRWRRL
jgi:hypothetical protein